MFKKSKLSPNSGTKSFLVLLKKKKIGDNIFSNIEFEIHIFSVFESQSKFKISKFQFAKNEFLNFEI
jgi:hypothetical protein